MLGIFSMRRVALAGGVIVALAAAIMWARWDAVRDYRAELRALAAEDRLTKIEEDRKRDAEIDGLGIDDLRAIAGEWLRDARD